MIRTLITAAVITLSATIASSAEFSYVESQRSDNKYIVLTGSIESGDTEKLQAFAAQHPDATHVAFNSPGGLASEGWSLGFAMSDLGLKSYVSYGHACMSACYTAFIGGTDYEIDGVLGAHVAWRQENTLSDGETASDVLHHGQVLGSFDTFYHLAHGFNFQLPYDIVTLTSHDEFLIFTDEEQLNKYFVRDDDDKIGQYLNAIESEPLVVHAEDMLPYILLNLKRDYPELFEESNP